MWSVNWHCRLPFRRCLFPIPHSSSHQLGLYCMPWVFTATLCFSCLYFLHYRYLSQSYVLLLVTSYLTTFIWLSWPSLSSSSFPFYICVLISCLSCLSFAPLCPTTTTIYFLFYPSLTHLRLILGSPLFSYISFSLSILYTYMPYPLYPTSLIFSTSRFPFPFPVQQTH